MVSFLASKNVCYIFSSPSLVLVQGTIAISLIFIWGFFFSRALFTSLASQRLMARLETGAGFIPRPPPPSVVAMDGSSPVYRAPLENLFLGSSVGRPAL